MEELKELLVSLKSEVAVGKRKKTQLVCSSSAKQDGFMKRSPSIGKPVLEQLRSLLFRKSLNNSEAKNFKILLKMSHSGISPNKSKKTMNGKYANNNS